MFRNRQHGKRLLIGVLAALVVGILLDTLPISTPLWAVEHRFLGFFYFWPAIIDFPGAFIAMFVGAYVARTDFVVTAVILGVISWLIAIYLLYSIALPVSEPNIRDIAAMNVLGFLIVLGGAVLGAKTGRWFYLRRESRVTHVV